MLLSRNRLFERRPPSREAKIIYIFCEGADRELRYFQYFREMDSRIHLEIYGLHPHEDNSPLGLFHIATTALVTSAENPNPKFNFQEQDEVWIVLDTDPDKFESRKSQIDTVRVEVEAREDWFVAESNPCFEVWLFFHGKKGMREFEGNEMCRSWKTLVNSILSGGFDPRKHPIFIEDAKRRAEENFELEENGSLKNGSTEVFRLAESILSLLGEQIREERAKISCDSLFFICKMAQSDADNSADRLKNTTLPSCPEANRFGKDGRRKESQLQIDKNSRVELQIQPSHHERLTTPRGATNSLAAASPIPALPPVITATLSFKVLILFLFYLTEQSFRKDSINGMNIPNKV